MNARLFCKTGQLAGTLRNFSESLMIGKGAEADLQLQADAISAKHARISYDTNARCFVLEDLGSRNGTRIDGARVRGKEKLGNLHVITFAEKFDFIFQIIAEEPGAGQPQPLPAVDRPKKQEAAEAGRTVVDDKPVITPEMKTLKENESPEQDRHSDRTVIQTDFGAPPVVPGAKKTPIEPQKGVGGGQQRESSAHLKFELEVDIGKTSVFTLREGENTVGRESSCDVPIDDNSISRNHAVLTVWAGRVTVKDLQSKNYTFVADKKIAEEIEIESGTRLRFGIVNARLRKGSQ